MGKQEMIGNLGPIVALITTVKVIVAKMQMPNHFLLILILKIQEIQQEILNTIRRAAIVSPEMEPLFKKQTNQ